MHEYRMERASKTLPPPSLTPSSPSPPPPPPSLSTSDLFVRVVQLVRFKLLLGRAHFLNGQLLLLLLLSALGIKAEGIQGWSINAKAKRPNPPPHTHTRITTNEKENTHGNQNKQPKTDMRDGRCKHVKRSTVQTCMR